VIAGLIGVLVTAAVVMRSGKLTATETAQAYIREVNRDNFTEAQKYVCRYGARWARELPAEAEGGVDFNLQLESVDNGPRNSENGNIWISVLQFARGVGTLNLSLQMGQTPEGTWLICDARPSTADDLSH
jgi:hypothetical protein